MQTIIYKIFDCGELTNGQINAEEISDLRFFFQIFVSEG